MKASDAMTCSGTPSDQVEEFIHHLNTKYLADTAASYRSCINRAREWNVDSVPWGDMTKQDLNRFLLRPRKRTQTVAHNTMVREATTLRTFYRWLWSEHGIPVPFPMEAREWELPTRGTKPETAIHPVPDEIWLALWTSMHLTLEDRLFLGLGYFCGLRRAEMCQITPNEVMPRTGHFGSGTLEFLRKGGARRHGIAYAAIIDTLQDPVDGRPEVAIDGLLWCDLIEDMARYRKNQPLLLESMMGDDGDRQRIYRRMERIQIEVGIAPADRVTPHQLRHSAATNLAMCGVDMQTVKQQLSHANIEITERYVNSSMVMAALNRRRQRERGRYDRPTPLHPTRDDGPTWGRRSA